STMFARSAGLLLVSLLTALQNSSSADLASRLFRGGRHTLRPRSGTPKEEIRLTVLLYNYAEVQDRILVHAEQETARIFRRANVELSWVDCPVSDGQVEKLVACSQAMSSFTATLKLLTKSMAQGFRQPASRFGLTIPHHGSYVFC